MGLVSRKARSFRPAARGKSPGECHGMYVGPTGAMLPRHCGVMQHESRRQSVLSHEKRNGECPYRLPTLVQGRLPIKCDFQTDEQVFLSGRKVVHERPRKRRLIHENVSHTRWQENL